jgi:Bacterial Ig-like domain (group 3)/FG-GAP-like repeat
MSASRVSLFLLLLSVPVSLSATGMFLPVQSYNSGGMFGFSVAAADLNGDGKIDLVVANWCYTGGPCNYKEGDDGAVGVLLGNGDGTFQPPKTYFSGGGTTYSVAVADVNGDNKPDVLVANACAGVNNCSSGTVGVLLGNGDGTFQAAQAFASGGFYPTAVTVGDVNGDKKPDVILSHSAISVLLGNGDGTFQPAHIYNPGGVGPGPTVLGDIDGDGKVDLLVANSCDNNACNHGGAGVLLGNGDGTFQAAQVYVSGGFGGGSIALKDVNGDGKPDIVMTDQCISASNCGMGSVSVLLGNSSGTFQAAQSYASGGFHAGGVAAVDVNGDSKLDLVISHACYSAPYGSDCPKGGAVGVLLGNGDGTFRKATVRPAGGYQSKSLVVADLDGDGRTDVVVVSACFARGACPFGSVGVLLNAGHFPTTTTLTSQPNPSHQGQAVTLTAMVTSVGPNAPTGKVTFRDSGTAIGSPALIGGVAVFTKKNLSVGTHSITATYSGDTESGKSTSPVLVQVVN